MRVSKKAPFRNRKFGISSIEKNIAYLRSTCRNFHKLSDKKQDTPTHTILSMRAPIPDILLFFSFNSPLKMWV